MAPVVALVIGDANGANMPTAIKRLKVGIAVILAAVETFRHDEAIVESRDEGAAVEAHHFSAGVIETCQYLGVKDGLRCR